MRSVSYPNNFVLMSYGLVDGKGFSESAFANFVGM